MAEAPALEDGPTTLASGGGLTVHLTDKRHYGTTLLLATGSPQHIEGLRALASRKRLTSLVDWNAALAELGQQLVGAAIYADLAAVQYAGVDVERQHATQQRA